MTLHIPPRTLPTECYNSNNKGGEEKRGEVKSERLKSETVGQIEYNPTLSLRYFMLLYYLDIFILFRNRAPLLERMMILRDYCILKIDIKL